MQSLAVHPTLRLDLQEPVLGCGNACKILSYVLFSHKAHWNLVSGAIHNGHAKQSLRQENALGVVAKRAVTKVGEESFRFIKPVVNRKVVLRPSAKLPRAVLGMLQWVGHNYTSYVVVV